MRLGIGPAATGARSTLPAATLTPLFRGTTPSRPTTTAPIGLAVSHVYPANGTFTIRVTAVDSADNISPQAAQQTVTIQAVALETDPTDSTKTALAVGGTPGRDIITITPADASGNAVSVSI